MPTSLKQDRVIDARHRDDDAERPSATRSSRVVTGANNRDILVVESEEIGTVSMVLTTGDKHE